MILLQIKLEAAFMGPIIQERKQGNLKLKFKKPNKKLSNSRKNLIKLRRKKSRT